MNRCNIMRMIAVGALIGGSAPTAQEVSGVVVVPIFDERSGNATAADVLSGKTFSNREASGLSGTMPDNGAFNITPGSTALPIAEGYHSGSGTVAGDADLVSGNIKSGVTLFGVTGTFGGHPAPVSRSGQTVSYSTGDDGDLAKGVAWPNPRFTDNGDGTVTDNLTGLIWLKNADCMNGTRSWADALTISNSLHDGWTGDPTGSDCGLSDGSNSGDWRLPAIKEMMSLIDDGYALPALSNSSGTAQWSSGDAFLNLGWYSEAYWSSTTYAGNTSIAYTLSPGTGLVFDSDKTDSLYVWPVRSGL